jgi:HSP20 family protein
MDIARSRPTGGPGISRLRNQMDDLFRRFLDDGDMIPWAGNWMPAIDVAEKEDSFLVKVELPGMKADDINISVQGNTLSISGEKKEELEEKDKDFYHTERRFGSFRRDVALPAGVDASKIDASFRDGVLTIDLPKSEEEKHRKIKVKE